MYFQPSLFDGEPASESEDFLTTQLITYIGNKRGLLDFIGQAVRLVKERLGQDKIRVFDVFSGSGIVARYLKQHASLLLANDIEKYAELINCCYLSNPRDVDMPALERAHAGILDELLAREASGDWRSGFISELYAPRDMRQIQPGERVFYTPRNARFLDTARQCIAEIEPSLQLYLLAPLLSEASMHANTSGVFKGFTKNSQTGVGQFGGNNRDALTRILGDIKLNLPVFSHFDCAFKVYREDANTLARHTEPVDLAYLDPPYNQHPYGSNYFMLNLLVDYQRPTDISKVSGIPTDWTRSAYNKPQESEEAFRDLIRTLRARYLLISFNSEGFIKNGRMLEILGEVGEVSIMETRYNTFRGSRNLQNRNIHLKEYLYLVEKK